MTAAARARSRVFAGRPDQVSRVRDFVARVLEGFPAAGDAVLMASELATNALLHTASGNGGRFGVAVYRGEVLARVEVWDGGSAAEPVARPDGRDGESGAGLGLVEMLAQRWGHYGDSRGRTVWFEVQPEPVVITFADGQLPPGEASMASRTESTERYPVGSLTVAELLGQARALFDALSETSDRPRADLLNLLLAEATRRAARLRYPDPRVCACGETFISAEAMEEHLMGVFLPADDIGIDGILHAEVMPGTAVPWTP